MPTISAIIPVFRQPEFLNQALASIVAQTSPVDEIIVIDDGSGEEYTRQYNLPNQAMLICMETNSGPTAARNVGIRAAKGELIAFLDADDVWFPQKIACHLDAFAQHPEAGVTYSRFQYVDETLTPVDHLSNATIINGDVFHALLNQRIIQIPTCVVMRREALDRCGLFEESFAYSDDWDMWLRIARCYPFFGIDQQLVAYRLHPGQLTAPQRREAIYTSEIGFWQRWLTLTEGNARDHQTAHARYSRTFQKLAKTQKKLGRARREVLANLLQAQRANPRDLRVYTAMLKLLGYRP